MATCDHQFHGGDESDWILSTSASCLDGSSTASRILQELFRKHIRNLPPKTQRKRSKTAPKGKSKSEDIEIKKPEDNLIVKKISGLDDFDESQHLNGCPMKWLYNKRLLERNKIHKIGRICKSIKQEVSKKEKRKNLRDKTPVEVKIHKINLIEKYTSNSEETWPSYTPYALEKLQRDSKDLQSHKKKLAAKLNWKFHDESQDCISEPFQISSRQNYFPPRPLLGLKPLLSVLLSPNQDFNCCSFVPDPVIQKKSEASLSIQSLDLSVSPPELKPRPNTTNTSRWGSKLLFTKKLQIPTQITIKLEQSQKTPTVILENQTKSHYSPIVRKVNEKTKQTKSLSTLFYELKDKTNDRNNSFDCLIQNLTMDEGQFQIKKFFNITSPNSDVAPGCKISPGKRKKIMEALADDSELNLVCEKVRFCRRTRKQKEKQEEV